MTREVYISKLVRVNHLLDEMLRVLNAQAELQRELEVLRAEKDAIREEVKPYEGVWKR
jgi:cell division protein FtsB